MILPMAGKKKGTLMEIGPCFPIILPIMILPDFLQNPVKIHVWQNDCGQNHGESAEFFVLPSAKFFFFMNVFI
jgi:hypothetical protein